MDLQDHRVQIDDRKKPHIVLLREHFFDIKKKYGKRERERERDPTRKRKSYLHTERERAENTIFHGRK